MIKTQIRMSRKNKQEHRNKQNQNWIENGLKFQISQYITINSRLKLKRQNLKIG